MGAMSSISIVKMAYSMNVCMKMYLVLPFQIIEMCGSSSSVYVLTTCNSSHLASPHSRVYYIHLTEKEVKAWGFSSVVELLPVSTEFWLLYLALKTTTNKNPVN